MKEHIPVETEINGYLIAEVLWENNLGAIYKAVEIESRKTVSIQTFNATPITTAPLQEALSNHIRNLKGLLHPNILETHALKMSPSGPFLVMDYVPGTRLDDYITSRGPIHWQSALRITRQILNALQYAHDAHFIHNRLNPQHIIISRGNNVRILHFGIEHIANGESYKMPQRLMEEAAQVYSAPEHYADDSPGHFTSDIYSLGLIVHELLTGKHPLEESSLSFNGYSPYITNHTKYLEAIDPRPPKDFTEIVISALSRNPIHRPQSAEMMLDQLKEIEVQSIQPTVIYNKSTRFAELVPGLNWRSASITITALLILSLAGLYVLNRNKKNPFLALNAPLEAAQSQVSGPAPQVAMATRGEVLTLNIIPSGDVYLNGELLARNVAGVDSFTISKARHVLSIVHPELGRWEQRIDSRRNANLYYDINLNQTVPLRIKALDENNRSVRGEIFINGLSANAYTPTTLDLPIGKVNLEFKSSSFKPLEKPLEITIEADRTKPVTINVERLAQE